MAADQLVQVLKKINNTLLNTNAYLQELQYAQEDGNMQLERIGNMLERQNTVIERGIMHAVDNLEPDRVDLNRVEEALEAIGERLETLVELKEEAPKHARQK